MKLIKQDKFNFFIPAVIEKAGEKGEMKISGVCSSIARDTDDEVLEPNGFDFTPLLQKGYFNWNHQASKDPGAILGRPTKAQVINNGSEFYVEGFLYKGLKQSQDLYNLAKTLQEEDPERQLGFSIEGQAIDRDPINPKRIRKARITGVAITHCPKNPNTLLNIIKGEYSEPFVEDIEEKVEEINVEKAGEGSRGGKVIGHTRSGKAIYHSKSAKDYSDFSKDDHKDAADKHNELMNHHDRMAQKYSDNDKFSAEQKSADRMEHHFKLQREHEDKQIGEHEDMGKSMNTGNVPMPESVEGKPKQLLTKSNIYNRIFDFYTKDLQKSEKIYLLIEQVSEKHFNMKNGEITEESIQKAFDILNDLQKSKKEEVTITTTKQEKEDEEDDDEGVDVDSDSTEEEVEKACKLMLEKGKTRGRIIDDLVEKGISLEVAKSCAEKVLAEFNKNKDGGKVEEHNSFSKSLELLTNTFSKSLETQTNLIDTKFQAVGELLKTQINETNTSKNEVVDLKKSLSILTERLENLEKTPNIKKSVTNVRQVERFEKSNDSEADGINTYNISNPIHRKSLGNVLLSQFQKSLEIGNPDSLLEKAIMDLEISKSLDQNVIPRLRGLNIQVVAE